MDKKLNLCKRTSSSSLSLNKMVLKYADHSFWPAVFLYALAGSGLNIYNVYFRKYGRKQNGCGTEKSRIKYLPILFDSVARNTPPKFLPTFKGMSEIPGLYRDVQCSTGCTGCTSLTLPLYLRVFSRIFNSFQLTVTSHRTTKTTKHVLRILHSHLQPLVHKPGLHHGLRGCRPRTD